MNIKCNNGDKKIEMFFDYVGNVYLNYNNFIYMILINNDNNIVCVKDNNFNYPLYDCNIKKLKQTTDPKTLKGKIVKNINNDDNDLNIITKLYPEELEFYEDEINDIELNTDFDKDFDYEDDRFEFSSPTNNNIRFYETDDSTATYDTIIYEGSFNNLFGNSIVLKSTYCGVPLPYRLLIYSEGDFIIKTIGQYYYHNKLFIDDMFEPYFILINKTNIVL